MSRIRLETLIAAPVERVFDVARDIDVHQRAVARTGERAIAGRMSGLIGYGEAVTWEARHFGRRWSRTSRITAFEPPTMFIDEQVAGPFRSFRHEHRFRSVDRGTLMTDDWLHIAPFGVLGRLADRLVLDRYMRGLLKTRNLAVRRDAEGGG